MTQVFDSRDEGSDTLVNLIIAYECGELSESATVVFFADLVKSGRAWTLQGHYGRMAAHLIKEGFIDKSGEVAPEWAEKLGIG